MQPSRHRLGIFLFSVVIIFGFGCAYYNTFFWARQKFNQAEKNQAESIKNQQRQEETSANPQAGGQAKPNTIPGQPQQGSSITTKVSAQDRVLYDDAIKKAGKVLKLHPESKWVDDALWVIGKSYFALGDYIPADRKFKELVTNHPESKFADDCYFYMGLCQMYMGHNDQALSAFANIEKAEKRSPYLENVIFSKAVMAMGTGNNPEAIDLFGQYVEKYPDGDSAAQAMFNIGRCRESQKDFLGAFQSYSKVKSHRPSKNLYFDATLAAATAALSADSVQIGMKILENLGKDQRYFTRAGQIKLKTAEGYYLEGDVDKAVELYKDITSQNQRTPQAAEAWYRLGLIHQNDKFDLTSAKEAFGKAQSEAPESEFRGLALARQAQIAKLESYQLQLQRADSLKRFDELSSLGMEEPSPKPDTLSMSQPIVSDSLGNAAVETLSAPVQEIAQDSSEAASQVPVSETLIVPAVAKDTSPVPVELDSLRLRQAGGVDSGRFASILNADSIDQAYEDSIVKSRSLTSPLVVIDTTQKDSTKIAPAKAAPASAPKEPVKINEDSLRQAIVLSGIETRYLLSELYAYELNRPDSALHEYMLIADEHSQSPYAAKSLLAAANIEFGRNDTSAARALLERLIREHPETPQAAAAAELIQSPFDFGRNAMGMYATAESLALDGSNPDSAVALFKHIANRFPDLAPKASFAVAWVLDEVKGVEDSSAFHAYKAVVKDYPQTAYAEAANERLGNTTKPARRQPTQREQELGTPQPVGGDSLQDTTSQMVEGLPFAPPIKIDGQFVYPEALLSRDLRGKVVFKIKINISGKVEDYETIGPSGEAAIDSSAAAALLRTEFDTSELDLAQLEQRFQFSITFKRPDIDLFNDPYRDQRER